MQVYLPDELYEQVKAQGLRPRSCCRRLCARSCVGGTCSPKPPPTAPQRTRAAVARRIAQRGWEATGRAWEEAEPGHRARSYVLPPPTSSTSPSSSWAERRTWAGVAAANACYDGTSCRLSP